jgi:hypothetical protein
VGSSELPDGIFLTKTQIQKRQVRDRALWRCRQPARSSRTTAIQATLVLRKDYSQDTKHPTIIRQRVPRPEEVVGDWAIPLAVPVVPTEEEGDMKTY